MVHFKRMAFYTLIPFHRKNHPSLTFDRKIIVGSFDPGPSNFAILAEERAPESVPRSLLFEKINFGGMKAFQSRKEESEQVVHIWGAVLDYLDDRSSIFDQVNAYLFEKQLSPNHKATLLAQHFKSCLMERYRDRPPYPLMLEVSPRLKSKILREAAPDAKGKQLKAVSVQVARRLLQQRGDGEGLKIFDASDKKDDLADVVVQTESFFQEVAPNFCNWPAT